MKSKDVYKILSTSVGPVAKRLGFKRAKSTLSYIRPEGDASFIFWFQCSQFVWDLNYGSSFTCEFQLAKEPVIGTGSNRSRLGMLLSHEEWEKLCAMNMMVKEKQRRYFQELVNSQPPEVQAIYRKALSTTEKLPPHGVDFWFDYKEPEDVVTVANFFASRLEGWITKFLSHVGCIPCTTKNHE